MNKKRFIALMGGVKRAWAVVFNGSSTNINAGSEASIDNLADNAFTVEGYFNIVSTVAGQYFIAKRGGGATGWNFSCTGGNLVVSVKCATTEAAITHAFTGDSKFHHFAFTFDDAGDRKLRLFTDGVLVATGNAGVGAIVADAADTLHIGSLLAGGSFFTGFIGWIRISNIVRYTTTFTPVSRFIYPDVDANTVRLFKLNEGTGTTITDSSANAQNGTLANGTWTKK